MRSFYWLSLPFHNLSQCFCFFAIFRVLTNQTVFISQTNTLADLSEQNILLRLTKLDFWCTSAFMNVFLLSNFQLSSETDHFHLTRPSSLYRLPDHKTIIHVIRPTDNFPVMWLPDKTTFLLSDHQTKQLSCYQNTNKDHFPVNRTITPEDFPLSRTPA